MIAGSYHIPAAQQIPADLRVTLLENVPGAAQHRPTNLVHSSKNAGEAPLFLGASAFFALKQVRSTALINLDGLHGWSCRHEEFVPSCRHAMQPGRQQG